MKSRSNIIRICAVSSGGGPPSTDADDSLTASESGDIFKLPTSTVKKNVQPLPKPVFNRKVSTVMIMQLSKIAPLGRTC